MLISLLILLMLTKFAQRCSELYEVELVLFENSDTGGKCGISQGCRPMSRMDELDGRGHHHHRH